MLVKAFDCKRWADLRTLSAIRSIHKNKHAESVSFVNQQVNHLVIVEEIFKARLLNQPVPHAKTNSKMVPEFSELQQRLGIYLSSKN